MPGTLRSSNRPGPGPRLLSAGTPYVVFLAVALVACSPRPIRAQEAPPAVAEDDPAPVTPERVEVAPVAEDTEIEERLLEILRATEWFENPRVGVDEGVVFLRGSTKLEKYRTWAENLAGKTQDVVAVVNRIEVVRPSMWDLSPAWTTLAELGRDLVQSLPTIAIALLIALAAWFVTGLARRAAEGMLARRIEQPILRSVIGNTIAALVFLVGLYLALKVAGLTRLAATVLGGTGLIGLIVGIAFRDIAENFLASILISLQRPFQLGDLVEVEGLKGYVQTVTTRGTLLMDLEGNHLHVPNSTIYKNVVKNFSANPNVRQDFVVGIDYGDSVTRAQELALAVVEEHPATLADPRAMVLVEELGPSTVDLRIYFWVDVARNGPLKVRSALLRLVKSRFDEEGLTMPDESREVIFPRGVPVRMIEEAGAPALPEDTAGSPDATETRPAAVVGAEGGFAPDAEEIDEQARRSRPLDEGADLLLATSRPTTPGSSPREKD